MRRIYAIFEKLRKEFPDDLIFVLPDIINKNDLSKLKLKSDISKTTEYFGTGRYYFDVNINKEFDVIFPLEKPHEFIRTKAVIKYFNVNPEIETVVLPAGYAGICLVDFPNGKPNILDMLPEYNKPLIKGSYDILYLTTQKVMNRILELLG